MSLKKQNKPHPYNHRPNDTFIRPSVSQIIQMNKDNPDKHVTSADFEPQIKLNHFGEPSFIHPMHSVQARAARQQNNESSSSLSAQSPNAKNKNGLPNTIKTGAENLSGHSMDDVNVHYNSKKPEEIGALAYAKGTDIHLASGQEKHLPHEAWHVVQQKQGRVNSGSYQAKLGTVNSDSKLEAEADRMGAKMTSGNHQQDQQNYVSSNSIDQQPVIQPKTVPTNFGEFETTKFEGNTDSSGIDIILKFHPDEDKVDAKKIALTQSVTSINESGDPIALDPNQESKMVKKGESGGGYKIDQLSDVDNPIYSQSAHLGTGKGLEDTPISSNAAPIVGTNTNYELGHCYKLNPTDLKKDKHSAGLYDGPEDSKVKGKTKMFETTALAVDGVDKDTYYGSVKWGYKMEGTDALPTLTKFDISEASKGTPTEKYMEPAKLWNAAKTRGTLKVSADPDATVDLHVVSLSGDTTYTSLKLLKDTQLEQIQPISWGPDQAITAKVLTGPNAGKKVDIHNKNVADMGDGSANKVLPIK